MRGDKVAAILEGISQVSGAMADFASAFLAAGYGASASRLQYEFDKRERRRARARALSEEQKRKRQQFYNLMMHLRRDGLIEERLKKGKNILTITTKGLFKLRQLRQQSKSPLPASRYARTSSERVVIVGFDIPEKARRKRAWLRSALKNLGFKMAQQSLWIGKVKIPEVFLNDLRRLDLAESVEIFEVTKSGSLRHLI